MTTNTDIRRKAMSKLIVCSDFGDFGAGVSVPTDHAREVVKPRLFGRKPT